MKNVAIVVSSFFSLIWTFLYFEVVYSTFLLQKKNTIARMNAMPLPELKSNRNLITVTHFIILFVWS